MSSFEVSKEIGRRLRDRRQTLSLSQAQLGARCGLALVQVQGYEAGAPIPAPELWRLARAMHVPPTYFFEGLKNRWPPAPARPH